MESTSMSSAFAAPAPAAAIPNTREATSIRLIVIRSPWS
jgi:hypothetical protein